MQVQASNILPVIFRKFGVAILQPRGPPGLFLTGYLLWIPTEYLSKVNGNYATPDPFKLTNECHISNFLHPIHLVSLLADIALS